MRRPPFVALSGRLPHDAILLMKMSCRIRSTDESVLPPADILCKSFPCSIGEESREPASRLPACRDGAAIASREYKPRCRTMLDCPRWHVKRELSPRRATFVPPGVLLEKREPGLEPNSLLVLVWCRRGDSNPHGFPHHVITIIHESDYFFNSPFAHFSKGFGLGLYQWEASTQTYPTSILSPWTVPFQVIFPFVGLVVTASNWITPPSTVAVYAPSP